MYSLLIVDDECQTRTGLRDFINWKDFRIDNVLDADDGDTALTLLDQFRPDILITDIRMNRLDGITLAATAREKYPDIAIIFISGYSDSDYLKNAIRLDAVDYLYKPIRMAELKDIIYKLIKKLDAKATAQIEQEHTRALLDASRPVLIDRFLRSWFGGMLEDRETVKNRMELLEVCFPLNKGIIAVVFQPEWHHFPSAAQTETCLLLLEESIKSQFTDALICVRDTGISILLSIDNAEMLPYIKQKLEVIFNTMHSNTSINLLIGTPFRIFRYAASQRQPQAY